MMVSADDVLSNLVLVPLVWMIGREHTTTVSSGHHPHSANDGYPDLPRGISIFIGVGAIATAGIFRIVKSIRIVAVSLGVAAHARFPRTGKPHPASTPITT